MTQTQNRSPLRTPAPPPLPPAAALYLDFDGTLVELAASPAEVQVPAAAIELLGRLHAQLDGALAIVTGRRLSDVDRWLAPLRLPGAGLHGAELRFADGALLHQLSGAAASRVLQALRERFGADPRLLIEDKGATVALHFRGAPERAAECLRVMHELVRANGLSALVGKQVVEALPPGTDKGQAIRELAAHAPFRGRLPVFAGDDRTDEDGFQVAAALGGFGVKVGVGETHANFRCLTVAEVRAWLSRSLRP